MKRIIVLVIATSMSFSTVFAQGADGIKGLWMNASKEAKVEIYKLGEKYFGKIVWGKDMYEADGRTPKKDVKNAKEELRSRSMVNLVILSGFTYDDGEWIGGELYDPRNGKTYKSKMKLNGNVLEIRGYIGSPMFGKTTTWTRTS